MNISKNLEENISAISEAFADCGDLVANRLNPCPGVSLYLIYIDNLINRDLLDRQLIGPVNWGLKDRHNVTDGYAAVKKAAETLEIKDEQVFERVFQSVLSGDAALFAEGSEAAAVISCKGFKNRGVPEASSEVTVTGSREAFSEVLRTNTVLIRRRIRDTRLKVKQIVTGRRSVTNIALMYMSDIIRPHILAEAENRITGIDIDAVLDAGALGQLIEGDWRSVFPQCEITERPDKTAAAILEGRLAVIVDNSPFALIIPATLNTLCQSPEDYYQRTWIMSFTRLLRFAAAVLSCCLPGFYLAASLYHPQMLPPMLMLKMAAARQNVPFPAVIEILIMETAFELLREAGIRMPKAIGGTFGIVGGLIVGQAAVEAGIVSPIVVVVVALTAISSFAIPGQALVTGFRLVKFLVIILSGLLGLLGFWSAVLLTLTHLASLTSFGIPYLFPFVSGEVNQGTDYKDSVLRAPLSRMKRRPVFARPGSETRQR